MTSKTTNKFSPEVRARAARMVLGHAGEHPSRWMMVTSVAAKIGCWAPDTARWAHTPPKIAVTPTSSRRRSQNSPTRIVDESGMPGFYASIWHGLQALKDIIAKLNGVLKTAPADPAARERPE